MDEFFNQPDDLGTVTLTLDNDEELECDIITFFTAGDNEYVALAPQGDEFTASYIFIATSNMMAKKSRSS